MYDIVGFPSIALFCPSISKNGMKGSFGAYRRKNYDIGYDIVSDIVYIYLTCHLAHAGSSLQRPEISESYDDVDRQMDDDNLRDYEDQFLEDFSP